jgi:RNA-directed DNA polymerase
VQTATPFMIAKRMVWDASKRVRAHQGAAGVDEESRADFEGNLTHNLSTLWNRLASGSDFPPPVRTVAIPKRGGGQRMLGMPTVADRMAQTVVAMALEPVLEPHVHPDS